MLNEEEEDTEEHNCTYLTFQSQKGCTIAINLRILGKYK
jgi:hypothetical protein